MRPKALPTETPHQGSGNLGPLPFRESASHLGSTVDNWIHSKPVIIWVVVATREETSKVDAAEEEACSGRSGEKIRVSVIHPVYLKTLDVLSKGAVGVAVVVVAAPAAAAAAVVRVLALVRNSWPWALGMRISFFRFLPLDSYPGAPLALEVNFQRFRCEGCR